MPDIVCLQELKAPQDEFPEKAIKAAGHTAIWHGQKQWNGVAILARNIEIEEITRFLPDDDDDIQSRYSEALINGVVIACIYLPNGNPAPGPKFDYKLQWFKKLTERAATLINLKIPVILIGYLMSCLQNLMCINLRNGQKMRFLDLKSARLLRI